MIVLDGNFALGCGRGTDYHQILIHIFRCTLERTDAVTNEVLEPITCNNVFTLHKYRGKTCRQSMAGT